MNNITPLNLITRMKWTNSIKNTTLVKLMRNEIGNLNTFIFIKGIELISPPPKKKKSTVKSLRLDRFH